MFYVINDCEAVAGDWLHASVMRALEKNRTCLDLEAVPYTEKGEPSKKYKPFKIRVFNRSSEWQEIWVYGLDKHAYYCTRVMCERLESKGIPVFFKRLNTADK